MARNLTSDLRPNTCYFDRIPEKLVLEGYRHWTAGFETGSIQPWEIAWSIYADALGAQDGGEALSALSAFIRTLKKCSVCPLRAFPFHSHHLCVEECLTMGLIAGIQHSDDVVEICLQHLACSARCAEVEGAAHVFAKTLVRLDQVLLPIPEHVIVDVLSQGSRTRLH